MARLEQMNGAAEFGRFRDCWSGRVENGAGLNTIKLRLHGKSSEKRVAVIEF